MWIALIRPPAIGSLGPRVPGGGFEPKPLLRPKRSVLASYTTPDRKVSLRAESSRSVRLVCEHVFACHGDCPSTRSRLAMPSAAHGVGLRLCGFSDTGTMVVTQTPSRS